jgi:lysophospholipase L1-like esterase
MNKKWVVLSVALIGIAVIASGIAWGMYGLANRYYHQLNATRLDPLGLSVYPNAQRPDTDDKVAVFFGDSRAYQWPTPDIEGILFVNRGIGAQTSAQSVERFSRHVAVLEPDIVIVQVGINDLDNLGIFPDQRDQIVANVKANIGRIITDVHNLDATVVLTTIFPTHDVSLQRRIVWSDATPVAIAEVNDYLRGLSAENVLVLDTVPILADENGTIKDSYAFDFLHINAAGYAALNQALTALLTTELE